MKKVKVRHPRHPLTPSPVSKLLQAHTPLPSSLHCSSSNLAPAGSLTLGVWTYYAFPTPRLNAGALSLWMEWEWAHFYLHQHGEGRMVMDQATRERKCNEQTPHVSQRACMHTRTHTNHPSLQSSTSFSISVSPLVLIKQNVMWCEPPPPPPLQVNVVNLWFMKMFNFCL